MERSQGLDALSGSAWIGRGREAMILKARSDVFRMTALVLFAFVASAAFAKTLDAVVAANYPPALAAFVAKHHLEDQRQQKYVTITDDGVDYIVAAYSNGHVGATSLLERSNGGAIVDCTRLGAIGSQPELELQDLDGDGRPEAIVRFDLGRGGAETWIYQVKNKQLTLISPTSEDGRTRLGFPDIVDFGRHGSLDLVDSDVEGRGDDTTVTYVHYVLANGSYAEAEPLVFYRIFFREKGQPVTESAEFDVPAERIGKPFRLIVGNGGESAPRLRVAGGQISLNGTIVSPASDFSESRGSWSVPVALQEHNTLAVRLDGKRASRIAIAIAIVGE